MTSQWRPLKTTWSLKQGTNFSLEVHTTPVSVASASVSLMTAPFPTPPPRVLDMEPVGTVGSSVEVEGGEESIRFSFIFCSLFGLLFCWFIGCGGGVFVVIGFVVVVVVVVVGSGGGGGDDRGGGDCGGGDGVVIGGGSGGGGGGCGCGCGGGVVVVDGGEDGGDYVDVVVFVFVFCLVKLQIGKWKNRHGKVLSLCL